MATSTIFVSIFILLFIVCGALAQECTHFEKSEINEMCRPYYSRFSHKLEFVLPAGATKKQLAYNATLATEGIKIFPDDCRLAALALTCAAYYMPCYSLSVLNTTTWIPAPRMPCRSLCKEMHRECKDYFKENKLELPKCDTKLEGGIHLYPTHANYFPLGLQGIAPVNDKNETKVACFDYDKKLPDDFAFTCPAPLLYNKKKDPKCGFPCPAPTNSEGDAEAIWIVGLVVHTCGLVMIVPVTISYFLIPKLRKYPSNLVGWLGVMLTLYFVSAMFAYDRDITCRDETTPMDNSDPVCVVHFILFVIGALGAVYWWTLLTVNVLLLLCLNVKIPTLWRIVIYIILFSFVVVSLVTPLAADQVTGIQGTRCDISSDDANGWWNLGLFYIPIMVTFAIVTLAMFPLLYKLISMKFFMDTGKVSKLKWGSIIRVLAFVISYQIVIALAIAARWQGYALADEIEKGFQEWTLCSIQLGENCERHRVEVNVPLVIASSISLLSGCVFALCFGSTIEVRTWWRRTLRGTFHLGISTTESSTFSFLHTKGTTTATTASKVRSSSNSSS